MNQSWGGLMQKLWQAGSITPRCPLRCAEPRTETPCSGLWRIVRQYCFISMAVLRRDILTGTHVQEKLTIKTSRSGEQLSLLPHNIAKWVFFPLPFPLSLFLLSIPIHFSILGPCSCHSPNWDAELWMHVSYPNINGYILGAPYWGLSSKAFA